MLTNDRAGDRVVGRYLLGELLGEGGMGSVYLASDEVLGRRVAVKLVRGANGPRAIELALREARTAARLNHPNVVTVHDAGTWEGAPYLVLEYLEGKPLRSHVDDATIALDRRLRWLRDVASGLAAAHEAGLVHRDVKPDNVFVTNDDVVKLVDFGIARPVIVGDDLQLSVSGQLVGTPLYMAPEQLRGEPATPAVDQFAFGLLAYELLARVLPWGALANFPALVVALTTKDAPSLRTFAPDVSPEMDAIVLRCLAKEPSSRHPSMRAVAAALSAVMSDSARPVIAAVPPAPLSPLAATEIVSTPGVGQRDRDETPRRIVDPPHPAMAPAALEPYQLALASLRDSNYGAAFDLLTKARSMDGDVPAIALRLAVIGTYALKLAREEARELLAEANARRSRLSPVDRAILRLFRAEWLGTDSVERAADDAVASFPNDVELLVYFYAVLRHKRPAAALLPTAERATAIDPECGEAWHVKVTLLLEVDREDDAAVALDRALLASGYGTDLTVERAMLHARRGDLHAWESDARQAAASSKQPWQYDTLLSATFVCGRGESVLRQIVRRKNAAMPATLRIASERLDDARVRMLVGDLEGARAALADVPFEELVDYPFGDRWAYLAIAAAAELGDDEGAAATAAAFFDSHSAAASHGTIGHVARNRVHGVAAAALFRAGRMSSEDVFDRLGIRQSTDRIALPGAWLATFSGLADVPGALAIARDTLPEKPRLGARQMLYGYPGPTLKRLGHPDARVTTEWAARGIFAFADPIGFVHANLDLAEMLENEDRPRAIQILERIVAMWGACTKSRSVATARERLERLRG